ncbi:MAG TPA: ATP-dependent DNA ligase [Methylomirabilota bacterium]
MASTSDSLHALAEVLEALRMTRSRLEKRRLLVAYLQALPDDAVPLAVTYLGGRPFPRGAGRTLSVGGATLDAALRAARPELTDERVAAAWRRHADAGDAAADLWADATPADAPPVRLADVAAIFEALHGARGPRAKAELLADAFRRVRAREIHAFVKAMLGEARIGVQEQTLEDAVAHATGQPIEAVRAANRHRADLGAVAREARRGRLEPARFAYFTPVDPMLAQPAADAADAVRRLGAPLWVEDKYDGVRCQLHKVGAEVRLYSRDRRELTAQFPEVVAAFAAAPGRYVLDGEVLAMEDGRALPFLRLQQRLGRLEPAGDVVAAHPVALVAFDCLARDDEGLLDAPLRARRATLEILPLPAGQVLAPVWTASNADDLDALFRAAQTRGNEGLMVKQPDAPYASGRRGAQWLKVKRPLETLDVVVVGAEWGHGKRRAVLSDLTFAVRDEATGRLATIGKAYNGLTDREIREMTERILTLTVEDQGHYRTVRPEIVLEVAFNHLQRSARHASGYALRFPRIVRVRPDRTPETASTLADVARLAATLTPRAAPGEAGAGESS